MWKACDMHITAPGQESSLCDAHNMPFAGESLVHELCKHCISLLTGLFQEDDYDTHSAKDAVFLTMATRKKLMLWIRLLNFSGFSIWSHICGIVVDQWGSNQRQTRLAHRLISGETRLFCQPQYEVLHQNIESLPYNRCCLGWSKNMYVLFTNYWFSHV